MLNRIWPTAVAGEADSVSSVSASACHIGGPNSVSLQYISPLEIAENVILADKSWVTDFSAKSKRFHCSFLFLIRWDPLLGDVGALCLEPYVRLHPQESRRNILQQNPHLTEVYSHKTHGLRCRRWPGAQRIACRDHQFFRVQSRRILLAWRDQGWPWRLLKVSHLQPRKVPTIQLFKWPSTSTKLHFFA